MIARYLLHVEAHRGYRPRLSLRRAPRAGQEVTDGGVTGVLVPCQPCSGQGFLLEADRAVCGYAHPRDSAVVCLLPPHGDERLHDHRGPGQPCRDCRARPGEPHSPICPSTEARTR